jgi:hypothetical protein
MGTPGLIATVIKENQTTSPGAFTAKVWNRVDVDPEPETESYQYTLCDSPIKVHWKSIGFFKEPKTITNPLRILRNEREDEKYADVFGYDWSLTGNKQEINTLLKNVISASVVRAQDLKLEVSRRGNVLAVKRGDQLTNPGLITIASWKESISWLWQLNEDPVPTIMWHAFGELR